MKKLLMKFSLGLGIFALSLIVSNSAQAHQSGCHRWHSCPSDSGSYICGDAGHPCQYPTYPAKGGVIYPPSGYYRDYYGGPLKNVPSYASSSSTGIGWVCKAGYIKNANNTACIKESSISNNEDSNKYVLIESGVYIRQIGSFKGEKIGKTQAWESYNLIGESIGWFKINYNNQVGWVTKDYATLIGTSTTATLPNDTANAEYNNPFTDKYVWVEDGVNVRNAASLRGEKIGMTSASKRYRLTGESNGWLKIDYNGMVGWVSKDFAIN